jgi:hypothetical protein
MGQLAHTGNKIRVNVRLDYMQHPEPLGCSGLKVGIDVPVGIHHQGLAAIGAAEEIAGLGKLGIVEAFEKHGQESGVRSLEPCAWLKAYTS